MGKKRTARTRNVVLILAAVALAGSILACGCGNLGGGRSGGPEQPPTAPSPAQQPPAAPTNLGAATISATQINLDWQDNANNEGGFRVYRAEGQKAFALAAQVPANSTSYQDKNLKCNTQYRYRVTAVNAAGESAPSNTVEAYTGMCP